jgi:fluoride exporter
MLGHLAMGLATTAGSPADGSYLLLMLQERSVMRAIWIGVAGFFGAVSRYWLDGWISRLTGGGFPWGTFVVNMTGCFLIGALTALLTERLLPHPTIRIAVTVGFLGAYTTFSTFAYESLRQIQDGAVGMALANIGASVIVGIIAAWIGVMVGRAI